MVVIYVKRNKYKIVRKKPKKSIKSGETRHTIRYVKGQERFIKSKKGNQIRYEK